MNHHQRNQVNRKKKTISLKLIQLSRWLNIGCSGPGKYHYVSIRLGIR